MMTPSAARMRPLLPRSPEIAISPANVVTQGRHAPVIRTAPAAAAPSPAGSRQLRTGAGRRCAGLGWTGSATVLVDCCDIVRTSPELGGGAGRGHWAAAASTGYVRLPAHREVQEQVGGDVAGDRGRVMPLQVLQLPVALGRDQLVPGRQALDADDVHVPPLGLAAVRGGHD